MTALFKMLTAALLFVFSPPAALPDVGASSPIGRCDAADGSTKVRWTEADRKEVRRRVKRACQKLGAAPIVCAYYDAVVVRESSGMASVRHHQGKNENGLGPMGLSLQWHRDKWPGKDEDPAFCTPEVSLAVAHAIVWRSFTRYHAESFLDVQAIYGGRWACHTDPQTGKRSCFADPNQRTVDSVCSRMKARGYSCHAIVTKRDLGKKLSFGERRKWVEELLGHPIGQGGGGSPIAAMAAAH
jgi:hypothetical protein